MADTWRVGCLLSSLFAVLLFAGVLGVSLVAGAPVPPTDTEPAQPATNGPGSLTNVTFNGSAVTNNSDGRRVIWQEQPFTATINYVPPEQGSYDVCLWASTPAHSTCQQPVFDPQNTSTLRLDGLSWPANETGSVGFVTAIRSGEDVIDRHHREILVLERNSSYDGDSLDNRRELELNTSVLIADTDQDGLKDGVEIRTYHTDPLNPDSDYDGLNDPREIDIGTNPNDADTDDDGVEDGREIDVGSSPFEVDTDGDGLDDETEIRWGTDPANPWTPVFLGIGGFAIVAVCGIFVSRRWGLVVPWGEDRPAMLVLPSLPWDERESRDTDASEQQTSHPAEGSETGAETDSAGDVGQSVDYVETDAERVLKILNRHDGRIRQAQLVEVNDWSESKVSRLLSEMESNGLVSKVTIGRENIVTLPGEEPTSGFDDDR